MKALVEAVGLQHFAHFVRDSRAVRYEREHLARALTSKVTSSEERLAHFVLTMEVASGNPAFEPPFFGDS